MKNNYKILALAIVSVILISCKKENNNPAIENNTSLIGKWQETKLRIYTTASTGVVLNDTTYSAQTFTNLDYVQFNTAGTCTLSSSHYYLPAGQGAPVATLAVGILNYTGPGPVYNLATDTLLSKESVLLPLLIQTPCYFVTLAIHSVGTLLIQLMMRIIPGYLKKRLK